MIIRLENNKNDIIKNFLIPIILIMFFVFSVYNFSRQATNIMMIADNKIFSILFKDKLNLDTIFIKRKNPIPVAQYISNDISEKNFINLDLPILFSIKSLSSS